MRRRFSFVTTHRVGYITTEHTTRLSPVAVTMRKHWYIGGLVLVLVLVVGGVLLGVLLTNDSGDDSSSTGNSSGSRSSSCAGRCGSPVDQTSPCHCHLACSIANSCCSDYLTQCQGNSTDSCNGRCYSPPNQSFSCQCNGACEEHDDCCSDYTSLCQTSGSVCVEVSKIAQDLWTSDTDRLSPDSVTLDFQGEVAAKGIVMDNATERLFTFVDERQLDSDVFATFMALLDNYDPVKNVEENVTAEKLAEEEAFLDAILATPTLIVLRDYLLCEEKIQNVSDFRSLLRRLWFDLYARSGSSSILDTSGFEHVMVGEFKSSSKVNGMHSWLSFYQLEKSNVLDYYGHVCDIQENIICAAFNWDGRVKRLATFFLRTSPAFDIAIYSLCFVMYPRSVCHVFVDGAQMNIRTYSKDGHIATAFIEA